MATVTYLRYDGVAIQQSAGAIKLINGTTAADSLTGTAGNDALVGNGGADTLTGGQGDDTYVIQNGVTTVVEAAGGGIDTVKATTHYMLGANVENLMLMGYTSKGTMTGVGNGLSNLIVGDINSQTFIGMGGNDVLVGGGGVDTFAFDAGSGRDVITDFTAGKGAGADTVRLSGVSFTSFDQIKSAMTQVGADVVLKISATSDITFRNVSVDAFTADNFKLPIDLSKYTQTFGEDFNTLSLQTNGLASTGVWSAEYGFGGYGSKASHFIGYYTGEDQIYVDPSFKGSGTTALGLNPFALDKGVLSINASINSEAVQTSLWGFDYSSGLLTTKTTFTQLYGYFEIRAQMPTGSGGWPAFWLLSPTSTNEIDVFEVNSSSPNVINMTVHDKSLANKSVSSAAYLPDAATGFHNYGVLWTAETITFYLDGVAVYQIPTPDKMHEPMYMLVNLAVGGWAGDVDNSNLTTALKVDYIRAYSLDAPQAALPDAGKAVEEAAAVVLDPATVIGAASSDFRVYAGVDGGYELVNIKTGAVQHLTAAAQLQFTDVLDAASDLSSGAAKVGGAGNDVLSLSSSGLLIGAAGDDQLNGSDGKDVLFGGLGADTLTGGGGDDVMFGGVGDDTYVVGAGDSILELANEGTDTVRTTLDGYTLGWNFENLAYAGANAFTGIGNTVNNVITGGAGNDSLSGLLGADTLNGGAGNDTLDGGIGADLLVGGVGDDTYVVDNKADAIVEAVGGGFDTINVVTGYALPGAAEIERIVMAAGSTAMNVVGNEFAQTIVGNAGINLLDGGGGADTLIGGAGNDTYVVDHAGDRVVEDVGAGYDLVRTSLSSHTLAANVENLTYTGAGAFAGTGNDLVNVITGGAGNDTLDGGAGGDRLVGGAGDDTYLIDSSSDAIVEAVGGGYDTQVTTLTNAMARTNIEALSYSGSNNFVGYANATGTVITGGTGNDTLVGGVGADVLNGGSGGNDVLTGGAGADVFRFDNLGAGVDRITDFQAGVDHIALKATAFGVTTLSDLSFVSGVAPTAADGHAALLYDTKTGGLYFDATGGDSGDKVQIATLTNKAGIALSDFWLI